MHKDEPLLSIIILNYNAGNLLLRCIDSIHSCNYNNYEIIIVDNNSTDNSQILCKEKFPDVKLIQNEKNLGYCEGNNIGIRESKGDFLAILNPDTIVDKQWLSELLNSYKTNGEGLYQPKLLVLHDKSRINSVGNMIQIFGFGYSRGKGEIDDGKYDEFQQIGFASGACIFTTNSIMKKIGYFESFLFAYNEDMDLGWRAAKMGINSYYVPSSVVYHAESYSYKWSQEKFFLLERNRHYCLLTHYSKKTLFISFPIIALVEIAIFFYFLSKGMLKQKIKAYWNIIKNRKYISKKHKESERKRLISDKDVIKIFVDKIFVPQEVSGRSINVIFNKFLTLSSKLIRYLI